MPKAHFTPEEKVERRRAYDAKWHALHPGYNAVKSKRNRTAKHEEYARRKKERALGYKRRCIAEYGAVCHCCGETRLHFLTLDHMNGGGGAHRKAMWGYNGGPIYSVLIAQGFPRDLGLAVACFNCNLGRRCNGGVCPHKDS